MKEVGIRIKKLRTDRGMTQPELAQAIGCGQSTLSELENGQSKHPSSLLLVKLSKFFEVDIEWLLTGKGEKHQVSSMSPDESELLLLFRTISPSGRAYILGRTREVHADEHRGRAGPPQPPEPTRPDTPKRRPH